MGKIYRIKSAQTPLPYYGSTFKPLSIRFSIHKAQYNQYVNKKLKYKCSSAILLQYDDVFIELVEEYPCNNKQELEARELEYILTMPCVNIRGKGKQQTAEEYKVYQKEWRTKNIDYMKNYHKKRKLSNNSHSQPADSPTDVHPKLDGPNVHLNTSLLPMSVLLAIVLHKLQNTFVKLHLHI